MRALAAYRGLLSNRPLTKLLGGEFVSAIGDWLYIVALLVVIYGETGDPLVLGLFGAARVVPYVVLSIPAGIVADRFDRRMILLVSDLARGAAMLAMGLVVAFDGPIWALVLLSIAAACGSTFFYPAIGAYIPNLALERLVQLPVRAGDAIVREGEAADRFYIIESGTFTVTRMGEDGTPLELRRLAPGDVFGELGLLNAAPRSATVTALTDGLLLTLDGPAFLAMVSGAAGIRGRLQQLYDKPAAATIAVP